MLAPFFKVITVFASSSAHAIAEYQGKFTKYEDFGLLETDAEDASSTTYELGLGDGGDLAPVVQKDAHRAPKAILHWDVGRTELMIWQGEQWVTFKDSYGNVLVRINLQQKKLPCNEQLKEDRRWCEKRQYWWDVAASKQDPEPA
ncbi:hypothetical protein KJ359_011224 [Pestalotiopsis sp. 9143b]|nr:hypothetical protein KJ359_011224 [Pestalotiopsis sp. 9143b]